MNTRLWTLGLTMVFGCGLEAAPPGQTCEFGCTEEESQGRGEDTDAPANDSDGRDDGTDPSEPDSGDPSGDDKDREPDDPGDPDDPADPGQQTPLCCDLRRTHCLDEGGSTLQCDALGQMCETGACEDLLTVCPMDTFPWSGTCADAYEDCFGIRINKCQRVGYTQCLSALGDEPLCAARDAACTDRVAYCADLLGGCAEDDSQCDANEPEGDGESALSNLMYYCHDWGQDFDPCWDIYEGCTADETTCVEALRQCVQDSQGGKHCIRDEPRTDPDPGSDPDPYPGEN
jgi:hypothetical protein